MTYQLDLSDMLEKKIKSLERRQKWIELDLSIVRAAMGKKPNKMKKIIKLDQIEQLDLFTG